MSLEKQYSPKNFEDRIFKEWEEGGYFKGKITEGNKAYSIVLPPPNITGKLHMGHALDHTLQDVLIRFKRMQGYDTLWQPGTDHASIATEVKVADKIRNEEGKTKEEIGREEFLKRANDWRNEFGRTIVEQMKKLGDSCDFSRERFTMDEGCNEAVLQFFCDLYEKGYIYQGNRIINWCPSCKTSLSDAEVEHEETNGKFYHINYKIKGEDKFVEIATTRPETMLGDTAVAVNPEDTRYKNLIGKTVLIPVINREIPVIADSYVDMEFGTGVVKITPCHDPNDFEVGKRNNLEEILVIDEAGKINENGGKYAGQDRYECRKNIIDDIEKLGQLVKIKDHIHNVGHCYRCHSVVEPLTSKQWFVKMKDLAEPAIKALKNQDLKLIPERFDKIYLNWLENIRDWCISRQLWWGHRIPAYYCKDCNETFVSKTPITQCKKCNSTNIVQDEDVLDTWFSSALWPLSTLGYPNEDDPYMKHFFPTDTLVTGYDIIFFWVIRMVFSSLYLKKQVPFKNVLIHGLVRDSQGRKMSKSLGNGIDPLNVIENYGADALRMTLMQGNTPGNDMRYYEERVIASRNFANKIWNSARFILMNMEDKDENFNLTYNDVKNSLETSDKWIISRANEVVKEVTENMDKFELGIAIKKVYDFAWSEFCDWYIELVKKRLYFNLEKGKEENLSENEITLALNSKKAALYTLKNTLEKILKLLHPFIPFVTEEIWSNLKTKEKLIISKWPEYNSDLIFKTQEKLMNNLIDTVTSMRNLRSEMNIPLSKKATIYIDTENKEMFEEIVNYYTYVGGAKDVIFKKEKEIEGETLKIVSQFGNLLMLTNDLIDFEKEKERLLTEKNKLEKEIDRATKKLNNKGFVAKAPEHLIEEEKNKKEKYENMLKEVVNELEKLN